MAAKDWSIGARVRGGGGSIRGGGWGFHWYRPFKEYQPMTLSARTAHVNMHENNPNIRIHESAHAIFAVICGLEIRHLKVTPTECQVFLEGNGVPNSRFRENAYPIFVAWAAFHAEIALGERDIDQRYSRTLYNCDMDFRNGRAWVQTFASHMLPNADSTELAKFERGAWFAIGEYCEAQFTHDEEIRNAVISLASSLGQDETVAGYVIRQRVENLVDTKAWRSEIDAFLNKLFVVADDAERPST